MSQPSKLMSLSKAGAMPLTGLEGKFAGLSAEDEAKRLKALEGLSKDDVNLLKHAMIEGEGMLMLAEEAVQMSSEAREREAKQADEINKLAAEVVKLRAEIRLMKKTNAALKAETAAYKRYYNQTNEAIDSAAKAKAKKGDVGDSDSEEWTKV